MEGWKVRFRGIVVSESSPKVESSVVVSSVVSVFSVEVESVSVSIPASSMGSGPAGFSFLSDSKPAELGLSNLSFLGLSNLKGLNLFVSAEPDSVMLIEGAMNLLVSRSLSTALE